MNNIISRFTGMDGRIGRQQWWIGIIILAVVGIILTWILGMIFGTSMMIDFSKIGDPAAMAAIAATMQRAAWVSVIVWVVLAYPYLALSVKRRHDKDNNGMDAIGFVIFQLVYNILAALGWTANIVGTILLVVFLVYAIYMLVVLGFLKGTTGPNQYGADPLGGA